MQPSKLITLHHAATLIQPRDVLVASGFVAQGCPDALLHAIRQRFVADSNNPRWDLTVFFGGGPGDSATRGLNHLALPNLMATAIGGHYGQVPEVAKLVFDEKVAGYVLPMGSVSRMLRSTASHSPAHVTRVGLGTFMDPIVRGPELNALARAQQLNLVSRISTTGGIEYLSYRALPVRVALIKATTADEDGNLTLEHESLLGDSRMMTMAAKASGGITIAQCNRIVQRHSLPPRSVAIPGALIDYIVHIPEEPQSFYTSYNAAFSGEIRLPSSALAAMSHGSSDSASDKELPRDIMGRRACLELSPGDIVNLGIGTPESVSVHARHEGISEEVTLTTEMGVIGGVPASGHQFGPASNYQAMVETNSQFDFYNGGGLRITFLGMGQADVKGNVNVSKLPGCTFTGPGGFMDIAQCTRQVVFMGAFAKKGLKVKIDPTGALHIVQDGKIPTFVNHVDEVTFNGNEAIKAGQSVLYVTERAVFELNYRGLKLLEVAKGVDVNKDVLERMPFVPHFRRHELKIMDPRIFAGGESGLLRVRMGLMFDFSNVHGFVNRRTVFWPGNEFAEPMVLIDLSGLRIPELSVEFFTALREAIVNKMKKDGKDMTNDGGDDVRIVIKADSFKILDADEEEFANCVKGIQADLHSKRPVQLHYVGKMLRDESTYGDHGKVEDVWRDWIGAGKSRLSSRALRWALERDLSWKITPEDLVFLMGEGKHVIERMEFDGVLARLWGKMVSGWG